MSGQQIDPALAAAFASLPAEVRDAAMRDDKAAGRALKAAYLAEQGRRTGRPNRAARRRQVFAQKRSRG